METINRNHTIDFFKGFAFLCSLFTCSVIFRENENFSFFSRVINSIAAPSFIAISGYLLGLNRQERYSKKSFKKSILRKAGLLFLTAVLIDLFAWNIVPIISCNIFYLITVALLLSPLFFKIGKLWHFIIALTIILIPWYSWLGYHPQVYLLKLADYQNIDFVRALESVFLDGWFPLLPWIGLFLLAFWFGIYKKYFKVFVFHNNTFQIILALVILISGFISMSMQNEFVRLNYGVVYYPTEFSYLTCVLAFFYLVLNIPKRIPELKIFTPFIWIGRSVFPIFIILICSIQSSYPFIYRLVLNSHYATIAIHFVIFLFIAFCLYKIKKSCDWEKMPYIVRFLLGS